jgi:predicted nucleotidyltransferase
MRLPEKIRRVLEKTVNRLKKKKNIYGIGLFGSWSRGDATASSDVDLLILDNRNFNYEFVERLETSSLFIDLNYIPKNWIHRQFPPEIDQKFYEMQILYDRDWSLANTKLLMNKFYSSLERLDIRTEARIVDSDIYLSRATSAFAREDFKSAQLFAVLALESALKILVEIACEPFSNSRFIEKLELSANKLNMAHFFNSYLEIAKLGKANNNCVKEKLKLFKNVWNEAKIAVQKNPNVLRECHFKVRTKLDYYVNPAFLRGAMRRAAGLVDSGKKVEASHYLNMMLIDILENYVWFKSLMNNVKVDYTTLIRSLKTLEKKTSKNYRDILRSLNLAAIEKTGAAETIERVRDSILKIRKKRKGLIKKLGERAII